RQQGGSAPAASPAAMLGPEAGAETKAAPGGLQGHKPGGEASAKRAPPVLRGVPDGGSPPGAAGAAPLARGGPPGVASIILRSLSSHHAHPDALPRYLRPPRGPPRRLRPPRRRVRQRAERRPRQRALRLVPAAAAAGRPRRRRDRG